MDIGLLAAAAGIILVDLALSGDNVLVIAAAAARLPSAQRRQAIFWGGLGALVFRFLLATVATVLLGLPLLRAIGGLVVLVIAVRLLLPDGEPSRALRPARGRFFAAMLTILIADITMSLDNVLAVGALANGNVLLLAAGLAISMGLLFVATTLVAGLIRRLPWLIDVAAVVLGWTAAHLVVQDAWLQQQVRLTGDQRTLIYLACIDFVLAVDVLLRAARVRRRDRRPEHTQRAPMSASTAPAEPRTPVISGQRPSRD
jgi:YjbE family integral membrane protein